MVKTQIDPIVVANSAAGMFMTPEALIAAEQDGRGLVMHVGPSQPMMMPARAAYGARKATVKAVQFPDPIEAPPSAGLVHAYLIDADDERRGAILKLLSGKPNMVVRAYRSRSAFLAAAEHLDDGCVIVSGEETDGQDELAGAAALLAFIRSSRDSKRFACVMLADPQQMRLAIDAMKAGAVDCLLSPYATTDLLGVVEDALALVRMVRAESAASAQARSQIERLTARERDVLNGLLHGKSNKMIALDLGISPRTVEIYRAHLMDKLGTNSLSETLKVAFAAGMS